jgi:microcystin-dependent protein
MPGDFPIGIVAAYAGDASVPQVLSSIHSAGWLVCDGTTEQISSYPDLYKFIGTRYGGDGKTNFGLPDLRGVFVRGTDRGRGVDPDANRAVGSRQGTATGKPNTPFASDSQGAHSHNAPHKPTYDHEVSYTIGTPPHVMDWTNDSVTTTTNGAHTHTVNGGGDRETRPANLYLYYVIKYAADATVSDLVTGTVTPFAGDAGNSGLRAELLNEGWMLCDGSAIDPTKYDRLYALIGTSYDPAAKSCLLPDLRGTFVTGPAGPRPVGSIHPYTTALPTTPFTVSTNGNHQHNVPYLPTDNHDSYVVAGPDEAVWNSGGDSTSTDGAHSHPVSGGDPESRPVNLALDFLIKVTDT